MEWENKWYKKNIKMDIEDGKTVSKQGYSDKTHPSPHLPWKDYFYANVGRQ